MSAVFFPDNHIEDDTLLSAQVKLDRAFVIWQELHERYPTNTEIINRLGENYASRGDFRNGIRVTLKAVAIDPYFLVAHMNLGKMYFTMGESDSADHHFTQAVAINPSNSDVCWIYGEFLVFRRRVDEALTWFRKVRGVIVKKCGLRSRFGPTRKSSPWGSFSDGGFNQSINQSIKGNPHNDGGSTS